VTQRWKTVVYYGIPMLVALAIHWQALSIWFLNDDFAWLGLPLEFHSIRDLPHLLFAPMAQGTIRTISERLFFLIFTSLFGLHALPFHIWSFLTLFADMALIMAIVQRLVGQAFSLSAAAIAAVLWSANPGLAEAVAWTSVYNELAGAFFILLAFYLFLRYTETSQTRFWLGTWIAFILGFGAIELNVVFPALAAGYALCCARRYLAKALLLFIPSAVFMAIHYLYIPIEGQSFYGMHFDIGMFTTLQRYWVYSIAAFRHDSIDVIPKRALSALAIAITAALLVFIVRQALRRDWLPAFFLAWFLIVLAPLIPLKNHYTEYYTTIPAAGLALLAGYAMSRISRPLTCVVAALLACSYVIASAIDIHVTDAFFKPHSQALQRIVEGLEKTSAQNKGKVILLDNITSEIMNFGFYDDPFRLLGINQVYLTPGTSIATRPSWAPVSMFHITPYATLAALKQHEAVVYRYTDRGLQDITAQYTQEAEAKFADSRPDYIDAGNPLFEGLMGKTWYAADGGVRWLGKSATVELAGPSHDGETLYVSGYCPVPTLSAGPFMLTVRADGQKIGDATINKPDRFEFSFPMPLATVGKPKIEISVEVDHTVKPGQDTRDLSLLFGTFTMREAAAAP